MDNAHNDLQIFFEEFTGITKYGIIVDDDPLNTSSAPAGAAEDFGDQEEWEKEWEMGLYYGFQEGERWHWMNPPRPIGAASSE